MNDKLCAVCKVPSTMTCSQCNLIRYCSKDHQKSDWKNHRSNCAPFRIQTDAILGRHLVANRDIRQGEIVLKKLPLITGPKMATVPICLGCHKNLKEFHLCSKCSWPLCGPNCEKSDLHCKECKIFAEANYKPKIQNCKQLAYAVVIPLRALILKQTNRKQFDTLMSMQSHLEEKIKTPLYKMLKFNLIPILQKLQIRSSEEEVLKICAIFDTNSFEIRDDSINIRGLYPSVSLISHDCRINTKHSYHGRDHEMHVIATKLIEKGEIITTTYTQTLWCTLARRAHLKQAKNFDCVCQRCKDPTELGTYAGSILCENCDGRIVSANPLDENADWICEKCDVNIDAEEIKNLNDGFKREIAAIDRGDPANFEKFLLKHKKILHDTNCHVMEIKYALTQMYGNMKGFRLFELHDSYLDRKIDLCNELIAIADILEPGCSRFRGSLMNELQEAIVEKTRRDLELNKINRNEAKVPIKT